MRQSELQAKITTVGLVLIGILLLVGGYMYGSTTFYAGGMAALGQALLTGLAAWGLVLGRQQEELIGGEDGLTKKSANAPAVGSGLSGFRMSLGDDEPIGVGGKTQQRKGGAGVKISGETEEVKTLETGFQRMVVALSGVGFLILAGIIGYLIYRDVVDAKVGEIPLITKPQVGLDNLAVALAVLSGLVYVGLYYLARNREHDDVGNGDAVRGILIMGLPGMLGVATGIVLGYWSVAYAIQLTAALAGFLLVIQGAELLVSSMRSYAGIEEFDQEPVDLQKLPLVPMLTSMWVIGVKSLLAQSVGLSGGRNRTDKDEPGVFAQMMPRVLIGVLALAFLSSMFRVVSPGEVAIRERLGSASAEDIDHPLQPGLHICMPWPIDDLVRIPTQNVQEISVGTEEKPMTVNGKKLDFNFWAYKHTTEDSSEEEYITGDKPSPQLLGTLVKIWWKVKDPSLFYRRLSHNEFIDRAADPTTGDKAVIRPIYELIIQELAARTVTQTFATHTMDEIIGSGRLEVEQHCLRTLQNNLDEKQTGIEILQLTIKDVHPPIGNKPTQQLANGEFDGGPAAMYEYVIVAREQREQIIAFAKSQKILLERMAEANRQKTLDEARTYASDRITSATVERDQRMALAKQYKENPVLVQEWLKRRVLEEKLPKVKKIIVAPGVPFPDIWQSNNRSTDQLGGSPANP